MRASWTKYDIDEWGLGLDGVIESYAYTTMNSVWYILFGGAITTSVIFSALSKSNIMDRIIYSKKSKLPFNISFLFTSATTYFFIFIFAFLFNSILFGAYTSYWMWIQEPLKILLYFLLTYFVYVLGISTTMYLNTLKFENLTKIVLAMIFFLMIFYLGWEIRFASNYSWALENMKYGNNIFNVILSGIIPVLIYTFIAPIAVIIHIAPLIWDHGLFDSLGWKDPETNAIMIQGIFSIISGVGLSALFPYLTVLNIRRRYE